VSDNGIGMSREEVVNNIGTIRQSGRAASLSRHRRPSDGRALIGRSAWALFVFIVADRSRS